MTLDDFLAVLKARRIPTPNEFVAFVAAQGWRIEVDDTGAFLRAKVKDRAALVTAKMLSREPWRTNVLRLVTGGEPPRPYTPAVTPVAVPVEDFDGPGRVCRGCGVRHWLGGAVTAEVVALGCEKVACSYRGKR